MGLELPGEGSGAFHLMFFSVDQVVGAEDSVEMPLRWGPRKKGQLSAKEEVEKRTMVRAMGDSRSRGAPCWT
jgi:hypothetical protein